MVIAGILSAAATTLSSIPVPKMFVIIRPKGFQADRVQELSKKWPTPNEADQRLMRHVAMEKSLIHYPSRNPWTPLFENLDRCFPALETLHLLVPDFPVNTPAPELKVQDLRLGPVPARHNVSGSDEKPMWAYSFDYHLQKAMVFTPLGPVRRAGIKMQLQLMKQDEDDY
jgi:hypothetical protein